MPSLTPSGAGLLYGGDHNPQQWPDDRWREDVELIREAGVTLALSPAWGTTFWSLGKALRALGPVAGSPAMTRHATGTGRAWWVGPRLDDPGLDRLVGQVRDPAGVAPVLAHRPDGLEAVLRGTSEEE
jgi:beta-galactosidase